MNGDALAQQLMGEFHPFIVMRECMIDGPASTEFNDSFLEKRAEFFSKTFRADSNSYRVKVAAELNKIFQYPDDTEFHLWFEYDLFCQLNMWYLINCLVNRYDAPKIFWIRPTHGDWSGFGSMSLQSLSTAFDQKIELENDVQKLFYKLWQHYVNRDMRFFEYVKNEDIPALYEVQDSIQALIDLFPGEGLNLPQQKLMNIMEELDQPTFREIFRKFSNELGVYGYGDLQVKHMIDQLEPGRI